MKPAWILVAAVALAPSTFAQAQPMSQPPELKPPTVIETPAMPQLPPGVLDGRTPPSQAQTAAPVRAKRGNGALEMLAVRNATPGAAWVSVYDGDMPTGGACVQPGGEALLGVPRGARLRAKGTRDGTCEQPRDRCDATLELGPGAKGVELRGDGNACTLQVANGGLLKGAITNKLKVVNTDTRLWLWISRYDWGSEPISGFPRRNIVETTCLRPGQSVDYRISRNTYYTGGSRKFEAGIRGEFVQANCSHPMPCDTTMVWIEWWADWNNGKSWYIHYDPQRRIPTRFPPVGLRACGGTSTPKG